MGVEGKDISDAHIMDNTTIEQAANGNIQFNYTLPSGRALNSEFLPVDKRREAMLAWVEVIRSAHQEDAEEVRAQVRRQMEEARRGPINDQTTSAILSPDGARFAMPNPVATSTTQGPTSGLGGFMPAAQVSAPSAQPSIGSSMSPSEFAHYQVLTLSTQIQQLMIQITTAQQQLSQWQQIAAAFPVTTLTTIPQASSGVTTNEQSKASSVSDSGNVPRRRGRPRKRTEPYGAAGSGGHTD